MHQQPESASQSPLTRPRVTIVALLGVVIVLLFLGAVFLNKTPPLKDLSRKIFQKTEVVKEFKLIESSPEDQNDEFDVIGEPTLVFSKKLAIAEGEIGKYLTMSPSIPGVWRLEKNKQVVYFSPSEKKVDGFPALFSYDTSYTIAIRQSLRSTDGKTLPEDISITFKTKKHPQFALQPQSRLVSAFVQKSTAIDFYINDSASYEVTVSKTSLEVLMQHLSYKKSKEPLYVNTPNTAEQSTMTFQWQPNTDPNSSIRTLEIPAINEPGLYRVVVKNEFGAEQLFLSVSQHIAQVFVEPGRLRVWTTDSQEGRNLPAASVTFYTLQDKPHQIASAITDDNGVAILDRQADAVDIVMTKQDHDIAVTKTSTYAYKSGESTLRDPYKIFSYTDRPVYRPGDTVHYKAVIRKRENGSFTIPAGTQLSYKLSPYYTYSFDEDTEKYPAVTVDENGTVAFDLTLPGSTDANPVVNLLEKRDGKYETIDSLSLVVESYRKPDLDIGVTTIEKEYISGDAAHFTVVAKTLYGTPFANIAFTYRVLVNDYSEVKDRSLEQLESYASSYYGGGKELVSGSGAFDKKGKATIEFSTKLFSSLEDSQIAMLEITPRIGAAPSIGKIARLIHRGEFAIFIEDVKGTTDQGIQGSITTLDHSNPRRPIEARETIVSVSRVVGYEQKELVASQTASASAETLQFSFPEIKQEGSYEIVTKAIDRRDNPVTAKYTVYVGKAYTDTVEKKQFTLQIKTDKKKYQPGDTATVTVSSNFPLRDVVVATTVYKSGGYFSGAYPITTFTSKPMDGEQQFTHAVQIPKNIHQPIGIHVRAVYQGGVQRAEEELAFDGESKHLATNVTFSKQKVKPGETVTAEITTKDAQGKPVAADTSLSIMDAAILQIGKVVGTIYDAFYGYAERPSLESYNSTQGIPVIGGGGGGCFLAGTAIRMTDGTLKPIENVRIGDTILTRASDVSARLVPDKVIKTFRHVVGEYWEINGFLRVTPIHRIFLNNRWQEAKEVRLGDSLLDESGNIVKITAIKRVDGEFIVYNLSTETQHTFFADGIYVHNDKGPDARKNFVDTAYWKANIETNEQGKATVSFKVPDNITTFSAAVVANTKDSSFGQSTGEFVSTRDVVITPTIPNFFYQGDKPIVTALITNGLDHTLDGTIIVSIKELNNIKTERLQIAAGDFDSVAVPAEIGNMINALTFRFEVRQGDAVVDVVEIKRPVLPRGSIESSWYSFEGAKTFEFTPQYKNLEFNSIHLTVHPHIAAYISNNSSSDYVYAGTSFISDMVKLYKNAYLIGRTGDGTIGPYLYSYAKLKNNLRFNIQSLLERRVAGLWVPDERETDSSPALISAWILQVLKESQKAGLLNEISNGNSIVQDSLAGLKDTAGMDGFEEKIMIQWVLGSGNFCSEQDNECIAVQGLNGDGAALSRLGKVSSAQDRFIFTGISERLKILPYLAMIEKGSQRDADRAFRGLSAMYAENGYVNDDLVMLAAIKHALRSGYQIDKQKVTVLVNGEPVVMSTNSYLSETYLPKFAKDQKLTIRVEDTGTLPVYSTIAQTEYRDSPAPQSHAVIAKQKLSRQLRAVDTGYTIDKITEGSVGVVELNFDNAFATDKNATSLILSDALSPAYLFLNQSSDNSPQYQSALDKIYPSVDQYHKPYLFYRTYSDELVSFSGAIENPQAILPYVVYKVSPGEYYQPKTSAVLTTLGIILKEK